MKKQVLLRGLLAFPLGIALGYVITIMISLSTGEGIYYPCEPSLIAIAGNEVNAVLLQAILCGILGSSFGACSVIWETEWSILKQTFIYFFITSAVMMSVAYIANWMEHSVAGFLIYFFIFIAMFVMVWLIQYFTWKNKIKKLNSRMDRKNG